MKKPTVSLVLGGGHSIGVPLAVAARRSFIVPSATMTVHPVRTGGLVLAVPQSFDYLERMQNRIIRFVTEHSRVDEGTFRRMMTDTHTLANDIGTLLEGEDDGRNECIFTQERGGLLRFIFLYEGTWYWPFYCANGVWPKVSLSIGKPESQSEVKNFETYAGYVLKLFSNYGFVFGNQGVRFGHNTSTLGDYIELPAIEGRSLVQVNWIPDEEHKYSSLTATVMEAGSLDNPAVGEPKEGIYENGVRTWRIDGEASRAYWVVPDQNATYSLEILECIYE
jgi:hypothetical protein